MDNEKCRICGDDHHLAFSAGYHKDLIDRLRSELEIANGKLAIYEKMRFPLPPVNPKHEEAVDALVKDYWAKQPKRILKKRKNK